MRRFRDISIRHKQTLIMMLTSGIALLLACAAFVAYDLQIFHRELAENTSTLADAIGNNCTGALDFNDTKTAQEALSALRAEPNIASACIYDKDGEVFATYKRDDQAAFVPPPARRTSQESTSEQLRLFRTIAPHGEKIGTIYVASDLDEFSERLSRYFVIAGMVFLVSLLVTFALSSRLQRVISGPVLNLAEVARSVAQGRNYSLRATKQSKDELGQLVDSFNEMLAEIQERDFALQTARDTLEHSVQERTQELASSLALLNATLEGSVDGILAVDLEGRVTSYNRKFVALWGYRPEDMARRDHVELRELAVVQLQNADVFRAGLRAMCESPEKDSLSVLEFHDGRIVERLTKPQYIGAKCVGTVITFRDITERKRAEATLVATSALLETLLQNTTDGIYFKDLQSRFVHFSRQMLEVFHLTHPDELKGRTDFDFFSEEHARPAYEGEQGIIRTGKPILNLEEKETHRDGRIAWVLISKMLWRDNVGNVIGTMGISKDITERKRAEEKLRRTEELYRSAITGAGAVPYSYDFPTKSYVFMGDGIQQLIGYAPPEVNGELWKGIIQKSIMLGDAAGVDKDEAARRVKAGDLRYWRCDMLITTRDGKSRWISDASVQNLDESGQAIGSVGILQDITERKESEAELERTHRQLLEISRAAGMAEVATSVLHNVGNVLNSVNTSASVLAGRLKNSKVDGVSRVAELLEQNRGNLTAFLSTGGRTDQVISFLKSLAQHLASERTAALTELQELTQNVEHIKEIVAMQQSYARVSGVTEKVKPADLVEDALRMNTGALVRHDVELVRDYQPELPEITVEKHKVLQILVNLIRNAKYACDDSRREDKQLTVRVTNGDGRIRIAIIDNGIGIPPENLTRIFSHGFTTRKDGHGFGLHSGALAAKELGGSLVAHSDGPGAGASFTLELPLAE